MERLGRLLLLLFDLDGLLAGTRVLCLDGRAWRHLQGGERRRGHGFLDLLKDSAKALFYDNSNRLLLEIFLLFLAALGDLGLLRHDAELERLFVLLLHKRVVLVPDGLQLLHESVILQLEGRPLETSLDQFLLLI